MAQYPVPLRASLDSHRPGRVPVHAPTQSGAHPPGDRRFFPRAALARPRWRTSLAGYESQGAETDPAPVPGQTVRPAARPPPYSAGAHDTSDEAMSDAGRHQSQSSSGDTPGAAEGYP